MSNFSAIGFDGETPHDVERLLGQALDSAGSPPQLGSAGKQHRWWSDPSGAAFAAHLDGGGQVVCATPFFSAPGGGTRWRVQTSAPHLDSDCIHCSGADCDVLEPSGELVTRVTVQWALFAPYHRWLSETRTYGLELVAFASTLSLCRTTDDLEAAQAVLFGNEAPGEVREPGRPLRLANQAFMPYGMFGNDGDVLRRARAIFTGTVQAVARPTNVLTGRAFTHARVVTLGGPIDVVAPGSAFSEDACELALVDAWLVGRPCEPPPVAPESGGWLRKLSAGLFSRGS